MTAQVRARLLTAKQFEPAFHRKLLKSRDAEVRRVLNKAKGYAPDLWGQIVAAELDERPYLEPLLVRTYSAAGAVIGENALADFSAKAGIKAAPQWQQRVDRWIMSNAGEKIVSIGGTLKRELIGWIDDALIESSEMGIEKVTRYLYDDVAARWNGVKEWQVRRIVQTETMQALGVGQYEAMNSLGIEYSKTWVPTYNNTRSQHVAMGGVKVGMYEHFVLPNGDMMMYPSDPNFGASAENIINCSCGTVNDPV